jgi:cell division protein FtsZ
MRRWQSRRWPKDDAIDLGEIAERIDDPLPSSFRFTPSAPPMAPVAGPAPEQAFQLQPAAPIAEDDRPLTLFERMMGMSRRSRPPEAPVTLAPAPGPAPASDDELPGFMKRQVNR